MGDVIEVKKLDSKFKYQIMAEPGGEHLSKCFACGTCTASCPVREIDEKFNPRKIIRMSVLGMKDEVLNSEFIWLCSACYMCQERCPQDVKITELINAIKNVAVKEGIIHPSYVAQIGAINNFSRLYEVGEFENKKREKYGLPSLSTETPEGIKNILKDEDLTKFIQEGGEA